MKINILTKSPVFKRPLFPVFSLLIVLLLLFSGCRGVKKETPFVRTSFAFDTVIQITVYDEKDLPALDQAIRYCEEAEKIFSRTDPSSELYRLNENAGNETVVSDALYELLSDALTFCRQTDGAFDITLGALSSIYDFSGENHRIPDEEERKELLSHTGYRRLHLSEGNRVLLEEKEAVIDLGAVAKGYIADRMTDLLVKEGVLRAIINLGGNVRVISPEKDAPPFEIGISNPEKPNEALTSVILSNGAVSTSGIYQRNFTDNGILYHHILDSATGLPKDSSCTSVTAVTTLSKNADLLSTSCFVLGPDASEILIESLPYPVRILFIDKNLQILEIRNSLAKDQ